MGGSESTAAPAAGGPAAGASGPFAACAPGQAARKPGGPLLLSVVRTTAWGLGAEEDVWQVEILGTATVAELKAKIEDLYEVPKQVQKLALTADAAEGLEEGVKVEALSGRRVYLMPEPTRMGLGGFGGATMADEEAEAAFAGMADALMGAAQEAQEVDEALRASLQGVTYKVNFERPAAAGGRAAGKKIQLELDALALAGDVQQIVEVELFGAVGAEPVHLVFEGQALPPQMPLYHAGIEDGKTVVVSAEPPPPTEDEQLMQLLVNGGMAGDLGPGSPTGSPQRPAAAAQ